jgi:hypothetical protein
MTQRDKDYLADLIVTVLMVLTLLSGLGLFFKAMIQAAA